MCARHTSKPSPTPQLEHNLGKSTSADVRENRVPILTPENRAVFLPIHLKGCFVSLYVNLAPGRPSKISSLAILSTFLDFQVFHCLLFLIGSWKMVGRVLTMRTHRVDVAVLETGRYQINSENIRYPDVRYEPA